MQNLLDRAMIASRYILAVFYLGLAVALAAYAVKFGYKVWKFASTILSEQDDNQILLGMLYLVDSALVASLVAMVAISSYDSLVSRLLNDQGKSEIEWVSNLDPGNLNHTREKSPAGKVDYHDIGACFDVLRAMGELNKGV